MPSLSSIAYESIDMDPILPIKLIRQERNKDSKGFMLHWHEQLEFYYMVSGSVRLLCDGDEDMLYPGDIGFINWFQPHKGIQFEDNTVFYTILIDLELIDHTFLEWHSDFLIKSQKAIPTYIKDCPALCDVLGQLVDELIKKQTGYPFMVKSLVYNLFGQLLRLNKDPVTKDIKKMPSSFSTVRNILKYISTNYTKDVSLELLAKQFAFSKSHLCHIFKEYTNLTIHQYINELRCRHAASLIMNNIPLTDVYQNVGFSNYNYFSRIFKNIYGLAPRDFKRKGLRTWH